MCQVSKAYFWCKGPVAESNVFCSTRHLGFSDYNCCTERMGWGDCDYCWRKPRTRSKMKGSLSKTVNSCFYKDLNQLVANFKNYTRVGAEKIVCCCTWRCRYSREMLTLWKGVIVFPGRLIITSLDAHLNIQARSRWFQVQWPTTPNLEKIPSGVDYFRRRDVSPTRWEKPSWSVQRSWWPPTSYSVCCRYVGHATT